MPDAPAPRLPGLRLRALLVGLPLCVLFAWITVYGDMVCKSVQIGILQLPPPAIGGLVLVMLGARLVTKLTGWRPLEPRDLLPIYLMLTITVTMCSRGTIEKMIPPTIELNYRATPENNMMGLFADVLPRWLVAFDPHGEPRQRVARDYSEGNAAVPWRAFAGPLLAWSGLLTLVYIAFLCMAVILRRQWQDHEKLVFPLTHLPLTLMDEGHARTFLRNPLTWIGFGIPAVIYTINGLHANIPAVPEVPMRWLVNNWLTMRPWNAIQYTPINISVEAVGFFYFLSNDLLLSLWVFYVYGRAFDICVSNMGYATPTMPSHNPSTWSGYQSMGAYCVLVLYLVRAGWPHFQRVLDSAWRRRQQRLEDGPNDELLPYPLAVWGLVLAFLGILWWVRSAGLEWGYAVVEMGMYLFFLCFVLARMVVEAGILQTETSFRPTDLLLVFRSQNTFGARNLTMFGLLDNVLVRDPRGLLLSNFLDMQKLGKELKVQPRSLLLPGLCAVLIAFVCGSYLFLTLSHREGHVNLYGYPANNTWNLMRNAAAAMENRQTKPPAPGAMLGLGIVLCSALVWARAYFVGFPLHPLAYAVHGAWSMNVFWFSALLAWAVKGFILRSGGMKQYRRLMPLFLGLTLGGFTLACGWTALVMVGRLKGVLINPPTFGFD